jgi:uncharacterized protein
MSFEFLVLCVGAAAAGLVQGITGFAFAMVAMSIWVWAIDPQTAAILAVFGGLVGQVISVVTIKRGMHWALLWPFLAGAAMGLVIGTQVLPLLNAEVFKLLLGTVLVVFSSAMLFAARLPSIQTGGRLGDALVGVLGGVMALLGGFSGLAPALWCNLRGYTKDAHRAVIQNFNLIVLACTFVSLVVAGRVHADMLPSMGWVVAALIGPSLWGSKLYIGMSPQTFKKVVLGVLVLAGFMILGRSALAMLHGGA